MWRKLDGLRLSDLTVGGPSELHEPPASAASLEQVNLVITI